MSGYVKNTWVNQDVERPKTYEVTNNADGSITLTDSFGLVTELGTPVNADNMNHIEDGLTRVSITEYDNTFTYSEDDWVTGVVDGEKTICRSKTNNNTGNALSNDTYWEVLKLGGGGSGYQMFDIVMKDHVLSYAETLGLAQLGTYVYKEAIAGTRYGYPDFYAKIIEEYQGPNNTTTTVSGVTITVTSSGHKFYDIADKGTIDSLYSSQGEAWYYGIDTTNERIFLPRSTRFKNTLTGSDVGEYQAPGLPNITGSISSVLVKEKTNSTGAFSDDGATGINYTGSGTTERNLRKILFNASNSNPIYGASDTVEYASTKLIPYMVVGNQSTWEGMTDVVDNGLAILQEVNDGITTSCDGQWVASDLIVVNQVTSPTVNDINYNIASYLPNDGNSYEILVNILATTGSSSGDRVFPQLKTDYFTTAIRVCEGRTRANSAVNTAGTVILPVGAGRSLTLVAASGESGTTTIYLRGYRRLGTNP